jgi:molybdate transport system substrate-binding protein
MGRLLHLIKGLLLAFALLAPGLARAADVTVFAAASLTDALGQVGKAYEQRAKHTVAISFAASSVLAHQIEHAKGADMFVSADSDWMDYLDQRGLIARDTRRNLLGGHLVLIAPADSRLALRIEPHFDLKGALHGGRLAIADPESVPAGRYGRAALTALGVWNDVATQLAPAENVRAALAYVSRGETPLGIVYATDAKAEPRVRIVDAFPDSTHPPIVYPVALTKDAKPLARDFLRYLESSEALSVFEKAGFVILPPHGGSTPRP